MRKLYLTATVAVVLAGVIALVIMFAPVVSATLQPSATKVTDPKLVAKTALAFVAAPYEDEYQGMRVSGYVDNLTKQKLATVTVQIQLFDQNGNRKETVQYTLQDIPPSQRKTYDASAGTFNGPRTATIKVLSVGVVR